MLENAFFFWSFPFVYLLPFSNSSIKRYTLSVLKIHLLLSSVFIVLYVFVRNKFGSNFHDLRKEIKSSSTKEFVVKGCKVLYFEPVKKKKRRILLFPGLGISVRRMLQERCMDVFIEDSEIVCFQIRGLGESDWNVDICSKSMLDDSLNILTLFNHVTDSSLKTLFIGYSLGCFVSMQCLSHTTTRDTRCENILLVNGMCGGKTMVSHYKALSIMLGVNVKQCVRRSNVPITILHARDDNTVPINEAFELKRECDSIGRSCEMLICKGDHNHYEISREDQSFLKKI